MPPCEDISDAELMRLVQAGRIECFEHLVRRYQTPLLRVATSRLGRRDWAEDAAQETLLASFRSRMTFQTDRNFRTWLWTILLNQCRRQFKQGLRRRETVSLFSGDPSESDAGEPSEPESPFPSPLESLLAKERAALVDRSLRQLTEPQADAIRLRFFADLKFQEIADTMECSLLTAKNRVRYGLSRLAQLLAGTGETAQRDQQRGIER